MGHHWLLSFLRGMPLEEVDCDQQPERDAAILRSITTLSTINRKPAAEFWQEFDARPAGVISHWSGRSRETQMSRLGWGRRT